MKYQVVLPIQGVVVVEVDMHGVHTTEEIARQAITAWEDAPDGAYPPVDQSIRSEPVTVAWTEARHVTLEPGQWEERPPQNKLTEITPPGGIIGANKIFKL